MKLTNRHFPWLIIPFLAAGLLLALVWGIHAGRAAQDEGHLNPVKEAALAGELPQENRDPTSLKPCVNGLADNFYPCDSIDLLAYIPLALIGGGSGNDVWGWTDPLDGKEYALVGRSNGTAFLDVTDPINPIYLGNLPSHTGSSSWRDLEVYENHAYVVADNNGAHGMQVFDLTELRNVPIPPVTFSETAHYDDFGEGHTVAINTASGYAYALGTDTCAGGLHMIDIQTPTSPTFAGCYTGSGYTHDALCVNYTGPDLDYQGREICFSANGSGSLTDGFGIVDVTTKTLPVLITETGYPGLGYVHQGWLTDDQAYFLLDDELDEINLGHNSRTRVWDVSDLDNPVLVGFYDGPTPAIDHNLFIHEGLVYESNYRAGLRVLEMTDLTTASLTEIAYFDVYPPTDSPTFSGTWSNYPFFDSGSILINTLSQGFFVVRLAATLDLAKSQPAGTPEPGETLTYTITVTNSGVLTATSLVVTDTLNGNDVVLTGPTTLVPGDSATFTFTYLVQEADCDTTLSNTASAAIDTGAVVTLLNPVLTPVDCGYSLYLPLLRAP
ncbi:MAG: choice-of-anchor B family protein [Chloroflexi bacterium]|nr:choice-of-anchor B family protein [Chloroflexota bacterium]MCI0578922.1 choice-of-anchor B family protein [Chloroflexota bacterium]